MTFAITNTFTNGTAADATEVNTNFDDVVDELNGTTTTNLVMSPIGSVVAWLKSYTSTPQTLPGGWVECDGSVLSDANSVYNGQTLPDLNGGEFFRGAATSGGTGGSDTVDLSHVHSQNIDVGVNDWDAGGDGGSDGTNTDSALSAAQSILPTYYEVVWILRIK